MRSLWSFNDDLFGGLDSNHNYIVDVLLESCWPGEPQRDYALDAAIGETIGYMAHCQVLVKELT